MNKFKRKNFLKINLAVVKTLFEKQERIILSLFFLLTFISTSTAGEIKGFSKVIDGDTVRINVNKIRLSGIDAPEKKQTCTRSGRKYSCGTESTEALLKIIEKTNVHSLKKTLLFDLYIGKNIPDKKKSLGMGFIFQDEEKTLTHEEADGFIEKILGQLKEQFKIELRK